MGTRKYSRHQANGKKTVQGARTLNHTQHINILHSFAAVLVHGLRPEYIAAAEMTTFFVPP